MITLQKRPDGIGLNCTLLKREVIKYNQTETIPKGLKHVSTQQTPFATAIDQQRKRSTGEETQTVSELLGRTSLKLNRTGEY